MHYLITGHTGFKGSWLTLMLKMQGHTVSGISLEPPVISLFNQAHIVEDLLHDLRIDIRNLSELQSAIKEIDPEVIIHLAAQPLVRESYIHPLETFETNVLGTLNLLESTKSLRNLRATLIITTDKVYKNVNTLQGYVESDSLGGDDPYSASKAAADIAAQSWIKNFSTSPMAIARAGNVIGGGDWAVDRLVPELVKANQSNQLPTLRYPDSIRPWQHVLDCLQGYLKLVDKMIAESVGGEWNFGPDHLVQKSVSQLVKAFAISWGNSNADKYWDLEVEPQPHESGYLLLDSSKSQRELAWNEKLNFEDSIDWTVEWFKDSINFGAREITTKQIKSYLSA
jgi:CDP-glucose 4,6-dehydratase